MLYAKIKSTNGNERVLELGSNNTEGLCQTNIEVLQPGSSELYDEILFNHSAELQSSLLIPHAIIAIFEGLSSHPSTFFAVREQGTIYITNENGVTITAIKLPEVVGHTKDYYANVISPKYGFVVEEASTAVVDDSCDAMPNYTDHNVETIYAFNSGNDLLGYTDIQVTDGSIKTESAIKIAANILRVREAIELRGMLKAADRIECVNLSKAYTTDNYDVYETNLVTTQDKVIKTNSILVVVWSKEVTDEVLRAILKDTNKHLGENHKRLILYPYGCEVRLDDKPTATLSDGDHESVILTSTKFGSGAGALRPLWLDGQQELILDFPFLKGYTAFKVESDIGVEPYGIESVSTVGNVFAGFKDESGSNHASLIVSAESGLHPEKMKEMKDNYDFFHHKVAGFSWGDENKASVIVVGMDDNYLLETSTLSSWIALELGSVEKDCVVDLSMAPLGIGDDSVLEATPRDLTKSNHSGRNVYLIENISEGEIEKVTKIIKSVIKCNDMPPIFVVSNGYTDSYSDIGLFNSLLNEVANVNFVVVTGHSSKDETDYTYIALTRPYGTTKYTLKTIKGGVLNSRGDKQPYLTSNKYLIGRNTSVKCRGNEMSDNGIELIDTPEYKLEDSKVISGSKLDGRSVFAKMAGYMNDKRGKILDLSVGFVFNHKKHNGSTYAALSVAKELLEDKTEIENFEYEKVDFHKPSGSIGNVANILNAYTHAFVGKTVIIDSMDNAIDYNTLSVLSGDLYIWGCENIIIIGYANDYPDKSKEDNAYLNILGTLDTDGKQMEAILFNPKSGIEPGNFRL